MVMTIIIKIVITIISIVFTMNIATYLYVLLLWFRRGKGPGAVAGEVEVAVVALFLERLVTSWRKFHSYLGNFLLGREEFRR